MENTITNFLDHFSENGVVNFDELVNNPPRLRLFQKKTMEFIEQLNSFDTSSPEYQDCMSFLKALSLLENLPLSFRDELNKVLPKFNFAQRINILDEEKYSMIKNPINVLQVIKRFYLNYGIKLSYGLKLRNRSQTDYVPFLMEGVNETKGVFLLDQIRPLSVRDLSKIDRIVESANLDGAYIIAKSSGQLAKQTVNRYNDRKGRNDFYQLLNYDSFVRGAGG